MELLDNARGGYRFLTGIPAFSSGAAAMPGFEVVRVTLNHPLPYRSGFDAIDARPAVTRALQVLAEARREGPMDDKTREMLFGATQYQRR